MLIALINKKNLFFWDLAVITAQAEAPFESSETEITFFTKKESLLTVTNSAWNIKELEI